LESLGDEMSKNTKEKILDAAQEVFADTGLNGARMQKIADKAGVNKAMLHYYFKSKRYLFRKVFELIAPRMFPKVLGIIKEDTSLEEKIRILVNNYSEFLRNNPEIPLLIIGELHRHPEEFGRSFVRAIDTLDFDPVEILQNDIDKGVAEGKYRAIDARELLVNILSLCILPIGGRKVIEKFIFDDNPEQYDKFLESRKYTVAEFIINAIEK
jgi:AcrR family transcriptional regulator